MSSFSRIEPFVHTAELLSFRKAASRLGVTPTAVSKAVAALEADLGVVLLNRTSRRVALTPEGEVFLRHCREALDRLQAGRDEVTHASNVAVGRLKVSLSFVFGRPVVRALGRLLERYPRLEVHLSLSDHTVGLVEEEVDVAIRIGELDDSTLVGRRLRSPRWTTVASPNYLARRGAIEDRQALEGHTCIHYARTAGTVAPWWFSPSGGAAEPFRHSAPILLDQGDLMVDAAVAGLGVAQVFDFMVADALRRGELVEVLGHQAAEGPPIWALTLPGRQRVPRIRAFLDFVAGVLG